MNRDINKLRSWCIQKKLKGWKVSVICSHARIPRRTFYNWLDKYQEGGFENLEPAARTPKTIHRTPGRIVQRIIQLRKETGWNEKAITAKLRSEEIQIGHNTVYRVLSKHGLIRHLVKPRKHKTYRRWSRKHRDSLWQTDLCFYHGQWLSTFIDDCSRFITGIAFFDRGTTEHIIDQLIDTIQTHGKPRELITDHGTQYYASKGQLSAFTRFCNDQGIKHILGGIGKPTTLGKIERFHRTFREYYPRFNNLNDFEHYYNFDRPHGGLNYVPPAHVYLKK